MYSNKNRSVSCPHCNHMSAAYDQSDAVVDSVRIRATLVKQELAKLDAALKEGDIDKARQCHADVNKNMVLLLETIR